MFLTIFCYCMIAIYALIGVTVVLVVTFILRTIIKRLKPEKGSFKATVVADLTSVLILRDEAGKLYSLYRPLNEDVHLEDVIMVKCVGSESPDILGINTGLSLNVYSISERKEAKWAKVIRRLNKEFALCELGKKLIIVRCSADEQIKAQQAVSMVVSTKYDGNDRQILKCKDVMMMPVEVAVGVPTFRQCVRV